ncbi:MAG: hypothetical protein ABIE84_06745 [bacterium]
MRKATVFIVLIALVVVTSLSGCGETWEEKATNTALVGISVGVSAALISYALTNQNEASDPPLTDLLTGMSTSSAVVVSSLGFRYGTEEGFSATQLKALTVAATIEDSISVEAIADELAVNGIKLGGTTIEVNSLLTLLNSLITAAYELKEERPTDTRLLFPLYLVANSSGVLPDTAPILTAASTLTLEKATMLYTALRFVANYYSSFTYASAGLTVQAAQQDLSEEIASEITGTPVGSGSFGEAAAGVVGAYAGSLVGIVLAGKASAALVLTTGPAAIPVIPYLFGGARVTGAVVGGAAATFIYKKAHSLLGSSVTQTYLDENGDLVNEEGELITNFGPDITVEVDTIVYVNTPFYATVEATDRNGDALTYYWYSNNLNMILMNGYTQASREVGLVVDQAGSYTLSCRVSDGTENVTEHIAIQAYSSSYNTTTTTSGGGSGTTTTTTTSTTGTTLDDGSMIVLDNDRYYIYNHGSFYSADIFFEIFSEDVFGAGNKEYIISEAGFFDAYDDLDDPSIWDGFSRDYMDPSLSVTGAVITREVTVLKDTSRVGAINVHYTVHYSATKEVAVDWQVIVPSGESYAIMRVTIESTGTEPIDLGSATTGLNLFGSMVPDPASESKYRVGGYAENSDYMSAAGASTYNVDLDLPLVSMYTVYPVKAMTFAWLDWSNGTVPKSFAEDENVDARVEKVTGLESGQTKTWIMMLALHSGTYEAGVLQYNDAATNYQSIIDLLN